MFAAVGAAQRAWAPIFLNYGSIPSNSCIGTGATGNACDSVPASASIGANSCNGNGGTGIGISYGACALDSSLQTVGANSCNGSSESTWAACADNRNLLSVGANSCNGNGTEQGGACADNGKLLSVGANSCNGGTATSDGACTANKQLQSVGSNSCNGNTDPFGVCSENLSLVSVGNNSCDGPGACFGPNGFVGPAVGDCQDNTVVVPVCAVADLQTQVVGVGPGTSLADKLTVVQGDLASNDTADACGTLGAFVHEVNAQGLGASLITQAQAIQTALDC
jgi:hypothetical protein